MILSGFRTPPSLKIVTEVLSRSSSFFFLLPNIAPTILPVLKNGTQKEDPASTGCQDNPTPTATTTTGACTY
ncbi:MAG TPA: hypothetical protein VGO47_11595 [Chlamydiales bacterium]|nr:hypothetical protein [Chlamydiales bacterium]